MIHTIFCNPHANIAASSITDQSSIQETFDPIPFDAIIPLIEETWKDEENAYGEHYDRRYSELSIHAAKLRRQRQRCSDPGQYQQIEQELADVEAELCEISLKFDEPTEYPL